MKKYFLAMVMLSASSLCATVGFNCPKAETVTCRIYDKEPNTFVCAAESVKVLEGAKVLGDLPFYGPPMDILPGFDFTKAQWELVLGEYSYGFPDCVYVDKTSDTKMNFIYRPEDLRKITSKESCKFSEGKDGLHVTCEPSERPS